MWLTSSQQKKNLNKICSDLTGQPLYSKSCCHLAVHLPNSHAHKAWHLILCLSNTANWMQPWNFFTKAMFCGNKMSNFLIILSLLIFITSRFQNSMDFPVLSVCLMCIASYIFSQPCLPDIAEMWKKKMSELSLSSLISFLCSEPHHLMNTQRVFNSILASALDPCKLFNWHV